MRPEQRLAQRIIDERALVPPINVEALVEEFADIEADVIPANLDAILIRRPSMIAAKPSLILSRALHQNRKRFTLAHELAHLRLPWHLGTVFCKTEQINQLDVAAMAATEAEADWFAASLLMPPNWLRTIADSSMPVEERLRLVLSADVSPQAALISLFEFLPAGFAYAVVSNSDSTVIQSGKSGNTAVDKMLKGAKFSSIFYEATHSKYATLSFKWNQVHLWSFDVEIAAPECLLPSAETANELLRKIVDDVVIQQEQRPNVYKAISSITGHANGHYAPKNVRELHAIFYQRFHRREGFVQACAKHDLFPRYLWNRADELMRKRATTVSTDESEAGASCSVYSE